MFYLKGLFYSKIIVKDIDKKLENKHILHRFYKNYMRSYL